MIMISLWVEFGRATLRAGFLSVHALTWESVAMFAPKIAKADTKATESPSSKLAFQRSTLAVRSSDDPVERIHMLQRSIGNQAVRRLLTQQWMNVTGNEPHGHTEQEALKPKRSFRYEGATVAPSVATRTARSAKGRPAPPRPVLVQKDPFEHITDRIANRAMRMSSPGEPVTAVAPVSRKYASEKSPQTPSIIGAAGYVVQRLPGDGMLPPGDCDWGKYILLRAAVETAKAVVNALGRCTENDSCTVLATKIAAIAAEIAARVALDTTCFKGGDTGHRQQVQDKIMMLNRCYQFFAHSGIDCKALLAAAAAAVAAAAAAAAAAADIAAKIEAAAAAALELIEAALAAGEAAVEGATIVEVLEGLLVLAL